MNDRDMMKNLKKDLLSMYKESDDVYGYFKWKYDNNGSEEPPELRMDVKLEFTIPEANFGIAMRRMDEIRDEIERLTDEDDVMW